MRTLERIDASEIKELLARGEFFWLDLASPGPDVIDEMAGLLGWHPLAVEDSKEFGQRPKLDDYRDHALLAWTLIAPVRAAAPQPALAGAPGEELAAAEAAEAA